MARFSLPAKEGRRVQKPRRLTVEREEVIYEIVRTQATGHATSRVAVWLAAKNRVRNMEVPLRIVGIDEMRTAVKYEATTRIWRIDP
jgi:hypothetical protein